MANNDPSSTVRKRRDEAPFEEKANGHVKQNGSIAPDDSPETTSASHTTTTLDVIQIWAPVLVLIFGGCCSNVYTLESLIHASPSSGRLITALQFLLTALISLPNHVSLSRGWRNLYLKRRSIPLTKWIIYTAFFLAVNNLNNMAFNYRISVPLHIILRSAGPVTTMLVGRVVGGRTYPGQKILAVILLFVGVVVAALADVYSKQPEVNLSSDFLESSERSLAAIFDQASGFGLLTAALFLSAFMGLYTDNLYTTYGRDGNIASESLFYSHALSLSWFASTLSTLKPELVNLTGTSPPLSTTLVSSLPLSPSSNFNSLLTTIPTSLLVLLLNAITQYICISGVNRLSAKSSSLTVSIVLNIRKLISLLLSIWLFGNNLPLGVIAGAGLVFAGGGLYALPSGRQKRERVEGVVKKEL
jgi:solute carrier family 35 (UDP-xylose/UDP-N-acetylglucosamine transporter), member B4